MSGHRNYFAAALGLVGVLILAGWAFGWTGSQTSGASVILLLLLPCLLMGFAMFFMMDHGNRNRRGSDKGDSR